MIVSARQSYHVWTLTAAQLSFCDFINSHAVVVIHGATAHIGVTLIDSGIDRRTLFRVACPTTLCACNDTRSDPFTYFGDSIEGASCVRDADLISRCNKPC